MTFGSGPEMSGTPESRLADPNQVIADLQRQVAECKAELDQRTAEHDALRGEPVGRPPLHQGLGNTLDLLPTILAPRGEVYRGPGERPLPTSDNRSVT